MNDLGIGTSEAYDLGYKQGVADAQAGKAYDVDKEMAQADATFNSPAYKEFCAAEARRLAALQEPPIKEGCHPYPPDAAGWHHCGPLCKRYAPATREDKPKTMRVVCPLKDPQLCPHCKDVCDGHIHVDFTQDKPAPEDEGGLRDELHNWIKSVENTYKSIAQYDKSVMPDLTETTWHSLSDMKMAVSQVKGILSHHSLAAPLEQESFDALMGRKGYMMPMLEYYRLGSPKPFWVLRLATIDFPENWREYRDGEREVVLKEARAFLEALPDKVKGEE
jgi:hypothetical protein